MNIRDIYALFFSVLNILNIDISNLSVFSFLDTAFQGYKNIFNLTVNENSHYLNNLVLNKSHESWNMCVWFLQYGNGNSYVGYHMFFTIPYFDIYIFTRFTKDCIEIYIYYYYTCAFLSNIQLPLYKNAIGTHFIKRFNKYTIPFIFFTLKWN